MSYPKVPNYAALADELTLYSQLKYEYGAEGIAPLLARAEKAMAAALDELKKLPIDHQLAEQEPNQLAKIKQLRPDGARKMWDTLDTGVYAERLEGALLGRFAGCTLGAPVEFWTVEHMQAWALEIGDAFPPVDYWSRIPEPQSLRYSVSRCDAYTREKMDGVPVDDDITYSLLGLLVVEDFGLDFSIYDNGQAWLKYLPYACTAEAIALRNLKKGIPASKAGDTKNPYCEWIGADIRADPWGYMAPGYPEFAADMAYRDAYLSHRRNGIYGEMYFAAVIAAAFAVDDPVEALKIGLSEIPQNCAMAKTVKWALKVSPTIHNYKEAGSAIRQRFDGMSGVHTLLNACLTIWGITIGGCDLTRVIAETVAMGWDNDCTAATAGSIVGAVVGKAGIPAHWYARFNNTVNSYLIDQKPFAITDLVQRFSIQASKALLREQTGR